MGIPLPCSIQCTDDWEVYTTGDGTSLQSYGGTRINLQAGAGTGRSYLRKRIPARPGEKITVKCLALLNSGTPAISIDYPSTGFQKNEVTTNQGVWKEYEVSYVIPYTTSLAADWIQISIGVFNADAGNVDVILPRIEVDNCVNGFARTVCMGLVSLVKSGGVTSASMNANYSKSGIISVSYSSGTGELTITTERGVNASYGMRPIFNVSLSTERLPEVNPRVGQYDVNTGEFIVKFSDGTNFVDINTLLSEGDGIYLFVKGEGF